MNYSDVEASTLSYLIDPKVRDYGLAGYDRTHILKTSWIYTLPGGSRLLGDTAPLRSFAKAVLDGWQLSGIGTFMSGPPAGVNLSVTAGNAADWSGSPTDASRPDVIANPVLPKGERTFDRFFNTAAFALRLPGTWGNAAKNVFRGPGINNIDASIFKNFRLTERFRAQFRCEAYNVFNHTQFSAVNRNAQFNNATGNSRTSPSANLPTRVCLGGCN